jgi:hypothetical protein
MYSGSITNKAVNGNDEVMVSRLALIAADHGYEAWSGQTTICVGHHYTQTKINNVNKTCTLLQTTGGNDRCHYIPISDVQI